MKKRLVSILMAGGMAASAVVALPATAAVPVVPKDPLLTDPVGDANYLNDQGLAGTGLTGTPAVLPENGDNTTPQDAGSVSDLKAAWFTADADNVYAHFQTEKPGPSTTALFFRLRVDPGVGSNCLWFTSGTKGAGNAQDIDRPGLRTVAPCAPAQTVYEGLTLTQESAPDGTGIHTIKVPRTAAPAYLADGTVFSKPRAEITHFVFGPSAAASSLTAPTIDNTKTGANTWTIAVTPGGGTDPGNDPGTDPGTDPGEKPKKDCNKLKGKAKKKCKKANKGPKGPKDPGGDTGCAAFVPGDMGKEADTLVVTDKHTAEAPLEFVMTHKQAVYPASMSDLYSNVQVDSKAKDAGLYISYEFPDYEDHDLYVHYADGADAAIVGGFNPAPLVPQIPVLNYGTDGKGKGGHSEMGAEVLDGLRTADCGGWTVNWHNFLGQGGKYTAKLWLGEVKNEPIPAP